MQDNIYTIYIMSTTTWKKNIIEGMGKTDNSKNTAKSLYSNCMKKAKTKCISMVKKKKEEDEKKASTTTTDGFSNMPMFEVLSTRPCEEESDEPVVEGFKEGACPSYNIFCDDYYKNIGNSGISNSYNLWKKLMDLINYLVSPVTNFDQKLHDAIYEVIKNHMMTSLDNCMTDVAVENDAYAKAKTDRSKTDRYFTWMNANKKRELFTVREGFRNDDDTIASLKNNHPSFDPEKLKQYYKREADAFYKKHHNDVTEKEWFDFNTYFDEKVLTDPSVKVLLQKSTTSSSTHGVPGGVIPSTRSHKTYSFKDAGERSYEKIPNEYFGFKSLEIIDILKTYSQLPESKSPLETSQNVKKFLRNNMRTVADDVIFNYFKKVDKLIEFYPRGNTKYYDPMGMKPKNTSISDHLNTMTNFLCSIYFADSNSIMRNSRYPPYLKDPHEDAYLKFYNPPLTFWYYINALCKIGSVYLDCLNEVSKYKYTKTSAELTTEELKHFDLWFYYVMVKQTVPGGVNVVETDTIVLKICKYINYFNKKPWTPTSIDTPIFKEKNTIEFIKKMMNDTDGYPLNPDVCEYYKRDQISECLIQNIELMKQCDGYARTIKNELYRFLMIPVVVVIFYNFYYIFFFKDVFRYAKSYDEVGEPTYHQDISGCFHPIFPSWENEFHKFEQKKAEYFLEFIFKPLNVFVALLNWGKDMFRYCLKGVSGLFGGIIDNNRISYLLFMASFVAVYAIIHNHWVTFYGIFRDLINLKIPSIPVGVGDSNESFYSISTTIIWLAFVRSFFVKGIGGIGKSIAASAVREGIRSGQMTEDEIEQMRALGLVDYEPSIQHSGGFLMPLVFILYWVFKGMLTSYFIPSSVLISVLYIMWMGLCGILNYTDNSHTYMDKIELIHRVMYTKLFDNSLDNSFEYFLKNVSFYFVFFIVEITIIYTLYKNMTVFNKMNIPEEYKPDNFAKKMNAEKALSGIKMFLYILCIMGFVFVGLWSANKYMTKISYLRECYNNVDGTLRLDTDTCDPSIPTTKPPEEDAEEDTEDVFYDKYKEEEIEDYNNVVSNPTESYGFKHPWNSRKYCGVFMDYYTYKTGKIVKRPIVKQMLNKWNKYAKQFESYMNESIAYSSEMPDKSRWLDQYTNWFTKPVSAAMNPVTAGLNSLALSGTIGIAKGVKSPVETATAGLSAVGSGVATALGSGASALGSGATALGSGATALGSGAAALGSGATTALGSGASALGSGASALGSGAAALGSKGVSYTKKKLSQVKNFANDVKNTMSSNLTGSVDGILSSMGTFLA